MTKPSEPKPTNQEIIADLLRAKVAFQLATLRRVMGL